MAALERGRSLTRSGRSVIRSRLMVPRAAPLASEIEQSVAGTAFTLARGGRPVTGTAFELTGAGPSAREIVSNLSGTRLMERETSSNLTAAASNLRETASNLASHGHLETLFALLVTRNRDSTRENEFLMRESPLSASESAFPVIESEFFVTDFERPTSTNAISLTKTSLPVSTSPRSLAIDAKSVSIGPRASRDRPPFVGKTPSSWRTTRVRRHPATWAAITFRQHAAITANKLTSAHTFASSSGVELRSPASGPQTVRAQSDRHGTVVLRRLGFDPATSSTPFIASLVEVLGLIVFVHVAKLLMADVLLRAALHASP